MSIAKELLTSLELSIAVTDNEGGIPAAIVLRAREEAQAANLSLLTVDPTNASEVMRLQGEVRRYLDLLKWLAETVEAGKTAAKRWDALSPEERRFIEGDPAEEYDHDDE